MVRSGQAVEYSSGFSSIAIEVSLGHKNLNLSLGETSIVHPDVEGACGGSGIDPLPDPDVTSRYLCQRSWSRSPARQMFP